MSVKINLVTNTYGKYHRQNVAVDSWNHLMSLFPDILTLNNIQFKDEEATFSHTYDEVDTRFVLSRSSLELVEGATKKLPVVNDIIASGAELSVDDNNTWILWVNSDCIILPTLINDIIQNKPDMKCYSRTEIENVESFDEVLNVGVKFVRTEIAGFDAVAINTSWFKSNKDLFEEPYLLGKPVFDVVLAGISKIYGDPATNILGNSLPPYLVHIWHGNDSVTTSCPEQQWNLDIVKNNRLHNLLEKLVFYNLQYNLCRRTPWGVFINPTDTEKSFENDFFEIFNFRRQNTIKPIEYIK